MKKIPFSLWFYFLFFAAYARENGENRCFLFMDHYYIALSEAGENENENGFPGTFFSGGENPDRAFCFDIKKAVYGNVFRKIFPLPRVNAEERAFSRSGEIPPYLSESVDAGNFSFSWNLGEIGVAGAYPADAGDVFMYIKILDVMVEHRPSHFGVESNIWRYRYCPGPDGGTREYLDCLNAAFYFDFYRTLSPGDIFRSVNPRRPLSGGGKKNGAFRRAAENFFDKRENIDFSWGPYISAHYLVVEHLRKINWEMYTCEVGFKIKFRTTHQKYRIPVQAFGNKIAYYRSDSKTEQVLYGDVSVDLFYLMSLVSGGARKLEAIGAAGFTLLEKINENRGLFNQPDWSGNGTAR